MRQLFDEETSTLTYLVTCPETSEAVLIDPVLEQKDRDLQVRRTGGPCHRWTGRVIQGEERKVV